MAVTWYDDDMTTTTTPIDLLNALRRDVREGQYDLLITRYGDEEATEEMLELLESKLQDWGWDISYLGYVASRSMMATIQDRISAILGSN